MNKANRSDLIFGRCIRNCLLDKCLIKTTEDGVAQYAAWRHHHRLLVILVYDLSTEQLLQHPNIKFEYFRSFLYSGRILTAQGIERK